MVKIKRSLFISYGHSHLKLILYYSHFTQPWIFLKLVPLHLIFFVICRNRLLLCILNTCKEILGRLPKVVGIDIVELALWAKVHVQSSLLFVCFSSTFLCQPSIWNLYSSTICEYKSTLSKKEGMQKYLNCFTCIYKLYFCQAFYLLRFFLNFFFANGIFFDLH